MSKAGPFGDPELQSRVVVTLPVLAGGRMKVMAGQQQGPEPSNPGELGKRQASRVLPGSGHTLRRGRHGRGDSSYFPCPQGSRSVLAESCLRCLILIQKTLHCSEEDPPWGPCFPRNTPVQTLIHGTVRQRGSGVHPGSVSLWECNPLPLSPPLRRSSSRSGPGSNLEVNKRLSRLGVLLW